MMNRRTFLKTIGMSVPALAMHGEAASAPLRLLAKSFQAGKLKNWAWITINANRSGDDWKRMFAVMRDSGVKAILPEIYDGRNAYFSSQRLPVKTDLLGKLLPLALAE